MTLKFEGFLGSFLTKAAQKPDQNFALLMANRSASLPLRGSQPHLLRI